MKIIDVRTKDYEGGIALPDLESVKGALTLFEGGQTRDSSATQQRLVQDGGGMALMLKTMVESRGSSRFLERLFGQMEASLASRGMFYESYDYNGPGVFFKTSVEVRRLSGKDAGYLLSLNAAYVGNEVEVGLASALGVERGLWRIGVDLEFSQHGQKFEIDFDELAARLRRFSRTAPSGDEMATVVMAGRTEGIGGPKLNPGIVNIPLRGLTVTLDVGTVYLGCYYLRDTLGCAWSREGNIVRGPLAEDFENPKKLRNPVVSFSVTTPVDPKVRSYDRTPVLDPAAKARVRTAATDLVRTLKPAR